MSPPIMCRVKLHIYETTLRLQGEGQDVQIPQLSHQNPVFASKRIEKDI